MEAREKDRKTVPIWEKYKLTVDETMQYFGIGEKIRTLIAENINTSYCFTVQIGNKSKYISHIPIYSIIIFIKTTVVLTEV